MLLVLVEALCSVITVSKIIVAPRHCEITSRNMEMRCTLNRHREAPIHFSNLDALCLLR